MRIAILGPSDSVWIKVFIDNVLYDNRIDDICIISEVNNVFREYYDRKKIKVYRYDVKDRNSIIHVVNQVGKVDCLHIHYMDCSIRVFQTLHRFANKIIVTYWGSDLFRATFLKRLTNIYVLKKADIVHLLTDSMKEEFQRQYRHFFDKKIREFDFGYTAYDDIDRIRKNITAEKCKNRFAINIDKISVAIGYNAIVEQQHDKIITQITKVNDVDKNRYQLLLHMGYGDRDEKYLADVRGLLATSKFDYIINEEFLEYDDIAKLRCAVDIFIYGQTTDALSASFLEYLYAGCIVLKPVWLIYEELDKLGVFYIEYKDFSELPDLLHNISTHMDEYICRAKENANILRDYNSWDIMRPKWLALYED